MNTKPRSETTTTARLPAQSVVGFFHLHHHQIQPGILSPPRIPIPSPFPDITAASLYEHLKASNSLNDWIEAVMYIRIVTPETLVCIRSSSCILANASHSASGVFPSNALYYA
jgi:hypothetical protein